MKNEAYGEFAKVLTEILLRAPDLAGQLSKSVSRSLYWVQLMAKGRSPPPDRWVLDQWAHQDLISEEDRDRLVAAVPARRRALSTRGPALAVDKGTEDRTRAVMVSAGLIGDPMDLPARSPAEVVARIRENNPPVDLADLMTPAGFRPMGRGSVMSLKPDPAYAPLIPQPDRYSDLPAPVRMTLRQSLSKVELTAMQGGPAPRFDSIMGPILTESPPCESFTAPKRGRGAAARASRHADLADRLDAFALGHCDDSEAALFCEAAAALRGAP